MVTLRYAVFVRLQVPLQDRHRALQQVADTARDTASAVGTRLT